MGKKEYSVLEIKDVFRRYQQKDGFRAIAKATGMDRKTVSKYIHMAEDLGFKIDKSVDIDKAAYAVFRELHGKNTDISDIKRDEILMPHKESISHWLEKEELTLTKVRIKLLRIGIDVTYSSLYRFVQDHLGFGRKQVTVRMADTEPGEVAEVDFGRLGFIYDSTFKKRKLLYVLIITLVYSRYQYAYSTHRQNLDALITGIEEGWEFFGGVTRRVILDNLKAAIAKSDRYEPVFQRVFLEYSQHRGFIIDPTVVRHPTGKPTVERQVPYVRENFFKGEEFLDRDHVQRELIKWCQETAGLRIHGTTRRMPSIVFEEEEKKALLALKGDRFDIPIWGNCKVHPDHHIRFGNALYSVPEEYVYKKKKVDVRGDSKLVRIYYKGDLIKTHPVMPAGKRSTDYEDYPKHKTPYAMRSCMYQIQQAKAVGVSCGNFIEELLAGDFPWSRLRQAQKLLRLSEKYGKERTEAACCRALSFDLVDVYRVERIIKLALTTKQTEGGTDKKKGVILQGRFGRHRGYFNHNKEEEEHHGDNE